MGTRVETLEDAKTIVSRMGSIGYFSITDDERSKLNDYVEKNEELEESINTQYWEGVMTETFEESGYTKAAGQIEAQMLKDIKNNTFKSKIPIKDLQKKYSKAMKVLMTSSYKKTMDYKEYPSGERKKKPLEISDKAQKIIDHSAKMAINRFATDVYSDAEYQNELINPKYDKGVRFTQGLDYRVPKK